MQSIGNLVRDLTSAPITRRMIFHDVVPGRDKAEPVRISVHLASVWRRKLLLLTRRHCAGAGRRHAPRFRETCPTRLHPLTVLIGPSKPFRRCRFPQQERTRYLGMMSQQASRMQSVVQDLLTLSRLEGSPVAGHD